jgi:hypothetical protein
MVRGWCAPATGLVPLGRVVAHVMEQEPYRSAARVSWMGDTGSSHRGQPAVHRLATAYTHLIVVHIPVPASGPNHMAISCSIIQREVLTPHDCASLEEGARRVRLSDVLSHQQLQPCAWPVTRARLKGSLQRLEAHGARPHPCQTTRASPDTHQEAS